MTGDTESILAEADGLGYAAADNGIIYPSSDKELRKMLNTNSVCGSKVCEAWQAGWNRRAEELGMEPYEPFIYRSCGGRQT